MCSTVFFKHKYLTMPSLTPADALIQAADNLTTALAGVIPVDMMLLISSLTVSRLAVGVPASPA
jgi:hypothetical protein